MTTSSEYRWHHELRQLFVLSLERYRAGERDPARLFDAAGTAYLVSIGMRPQELYDFAEDHAREDGDPDWETVLLVQAARRDYFLTVQRGQWSGNVVDMDTLPAKKVELGGIPWLPRLIEKARAKLHGEMPADLMYGCSGDRRFFREHGLHPADFLRHFWSVEGHPDRMLAYVRGER